MMRLAAAIVVAWFILAGCGGSPRLSEIS